MSATRLIVDALRRGISLRACGDSIEFDAPADLPIESVLAELRPLKAEVLALLARPDVLCRGLWEVAVDEVSALWEVTTGHLDEEAKDMLWLEESLDMELQGEVREAILSADLARTHRSVENWRSIWQALLASAGDNPEPPSTASCAPPAPPFPLGAATSVSAQAHREAEKQDELPTHEAIPTEASEARGARADSNVRAEATQGERSMKISKFRSTYLTAADVPVPVTIVIDRVVEETIGRDNQRETKAVLYFRGGKQGIVLSRTTINQLVEILRSEETDDWVGQRVEMYQDRDVFFQGKQAPGIRFREPT